MKIKLGSKVKDKVSGFEGVITSATSYLEGCDRYCVTPKVDKDNKKADSCYFDELRLIVLSEGDWENGTKDDGGDRLDAPER